MNKTFYHHQNGRRPITVKIDEEYVSFHFKLEDDREFYWFGVNEWDFFKSHIADKNWHSVEISDFIDSCISKENKKIA